MAKTINSTRIPQTDSIEELAHFWDTHDLTDFEDELEEVTESVFERTNEITIHVHLQPQEVELVKQLAAAQGISDGALIRSWVLEKLQTA
jgi:hypothetical protein